MRFNLDNYETVESRLAKFWEKYPNGRIATTVFHYDNDKVVFGAAVFTDAGDEHPRATGYAEELRDASPVNRTSHVENAETSAIGRALANFVFQSKTAPRPSRQEMEKVARHEAPKKPQNSEDLASKFSEACVKAGLVPEQVAKRAGVDLSKLTDAEMPRLRDAFKEMQAKPAGDEKVEQKDFVAQVQTVFKTSQEYKEIKDPDAPATAPQKGKLRALLNGMGKQGPAAHCDAVSDIINRPVTKLDSLTKAEADKAIKVLDERSAR